MCAWSIVPELNGEHGSLTPSDAQRVEDESSCTIRCVSDEGYRPVLLKTWPLLTLRHNAIPNPRAAVDVSGWDWSWEVWSRVETAPFPIPGPGTTCIYVEPCAGGCGLENTEGGVPLPEGVGPGGWLACQTAALVTGVVDTDCILSLAVWWYDEDGISPADPYAYSNIVNDAFWKSGRTISDVHLIDTLLPLDGWHRYAANLQVPTALSQNGKPVVAFDFGFTVNSYPDNATGADNAALYFTNMQAEAGSEGGTVLPYCDDGTLA